MKDKSSLQIVSDLQAIQAEAAAIPQPGAPQPPPAAAAVATAGKSGILRALLRFLLWGGRMVFWLALAVLLYAAVVGLLFVFQRSLMYFPATAAVDPAAMGAADLRVAHYRTADGLELSGWYKPAAPGRATVVFFQGNGGHFGQRVPEVRFLLDAGYGLLLVGYRGYGGNSGSPTEPGLYADARGAIAWLAGQGVPAERLVLYGQSLGSGPAVQMATEVPVAAVILEAPFTSTVDIGQMRFPLLPVQAMLWDRYDNLSKIGAIRAPLFIMHGDRDLTVPIAYGRRLFAAAPEPKEAVWVNGAGHMDLYRFGVARAILDFLERNVSLAR